MRGALASVLLALGLLGATDAMPITRGLSTFGHSLSEGTLGTDELERLADGVHDVAGRNKLDKVCRQLHILHLSTFSRMALHIHLEKAEVSEEQFRDVCRETPAQGRQKLGEEWFELINACADESERLGGRTAGMGGGAWTCTKVGH